VITIRLHHPTIPTGRIQGFRFFWAYYVTGFNPAVHCQVCFKGALSNQFKTSTVQSGREYVMDERKTFPYLYICGVGIGPRSLLREKNFHLALRPSEGATESRQTYNGYTIEVSNAEALPIPELPPGWKGLPIEHTRCKNFRFAVDRFGYHV
jgi:hypothetical protein